MVDKCYPKQQSPDQIFIQSVFNAFFVDITLDFWTLNMQLFVVKL